MPERDGDGREGGKVPADQLQGMLMHGGSRGGLDPGEFEKLAVFV